MCSPDGGNSPRDPSSHDGLSNRHSRRDLSRRDPGHYGGLLGGLTPGEKDRSDGPFNFTRRALTMCSPSSIRDDPTAGLPDMRGKTVRGMQNFRALLARLTGARRRLIGT